MSLIAFIAILVLNLFAMVTSLSPLICTRVSQMNYLIAQFLSQKNQTRHWHGVYNWRYGHFCDIFSILAKIWLPWQRPLQPYNQKCLLWISRRRKPPVLSNHVVAVSRRNTFIAILVPKFVAMVTRFCPLYMGVPQMNSLIPQTLSQNQSLHEYGA